ncbi:MAG: hypothetical protein SGI98_13020 [Verrucomicrobiota bacterium]|nr:hypothetical protein [Verrucomicrobiota bacterium]
MNKNLLVAAAIAGLMTASTGAVMAMDNNIAGTTKQLESKDSCKGKDGCKSKDGSKDKDSCKSKDGSKDKDSCKSKDGCSAKK